MPIPKNFFGTGGGGEFGRSRDAANRMRIYIARTSRSFLEFSHFVGNLLIDLSLHILQFIYTNVICVTLFAHDACVCVYTDLKGAKFISTHQDFRDIGESVTRDFARFMTRSVVLMSFKAIFDSTCRV